ncbi:MAG: glycerophosphodiester phosphodiesterase family protein [Ruminococcaceae bacterium]|nr:glycerophosphodiester phosphodiesterase family protein [Oscillospiraceae bacterium]
MKLSNILILLGLLCLLLTGCGGTDSPAEKPEETTAPEQEMLILVGGADAYTIIRDEDFGKLGTAATVELHKLLNNAVGVDTDWVQKGADPIFGSFEILLGPTNRPESAETLGVNDYRIAVEGKKLVINGGSETAVANAVYYLKKNEVFTRTDGGQITIPADYAYHFDGGDTREEYIENPDLFLCSWVLEFDVPEWMTDYEEKKAAMADPDGRLLSSIHRGDFQNYPENSIEGIISAIRMGADSVELDIYRSRDGVLVLMHDATLDRTTDFAQKAGKNGLPTSNQICDWSFAELRQLRLRMNNKQPTDYVIPTFEEALRVCCGRTTIRLDRFGEWNWDGEIYPLVRKYGAYDTCIINYHFKLDEQLAIVAQIQKDSGGVTPPVYYRIYSDEAKSWAAQLKSIERQGLSPMLRWQDFNAETAEDDITAVSAQLKAAVQGKYRIYVDGHKMNGGAETPEYWTYLHQNGVNFVLTDDGMAIQKFIAENFEPTPYS